MLETRRTKNYVRCSVREPARCATNLSWPARIFFPSRSLVAPSASLVSWWHGLWVSEVGRALTSLLGGLGIALKSVHGTGSPVRPLGRSHRASQHALAVSGHAMAWPLAERLAEPRHRRRAAVPARLVARLPCLAPLASLWTSTARRARQGRIRSLSCAS